MATAGFGNTKGSPAAVRGLVMVLLAILIGCAGVDGQIGPEPDTANRCPEPGAGIQIGGDFGSGTDTERTPVRRLVLMGGGREEDQAAQHFVEAAAGGDVVVLRASGSLTSYPDYFGTSLAPVPAPSSVVTVRTTSPESGADPAVLCRAGRAEALWLAGGNQWNYLGRWPSELHDSLAAAVARGAAIGGTSAGAVSLGEIAFDARHGTVTSSEALANPLHRDVSVSRPTIAQPELAGTIVDSHFMERSREGRLLVFLARFLAERGEGPVVGLGLDEGVAVLIEAGAYRVTSVDAGAAWLYHVSGPATLENGTPLSLDRIRRVRLPAGSTGGWPFHFGDADGAELLRVEAGVVRVSAQSADKPS
ncbi:MAG: hypothetical protein OXI71_03570 [Gemmatimonadota bacterium]|nr:hypothetical protein [Gemmatimonadota bacterium]MXX34929.1 hypothetical protein [Gemmatimonadota bacterium]MYD12123.1 hypothetical protein [Gemmatimonadota bacterium]